MSKSTDNESYPAKLASYVALSKRIGDRHNLLLKAVERRFRYTPRWDPQTENFGFVKMKTRKRRHVQRPRAN
jgi:hypothetical protein